MCLFKDNGYTFSWGSSTKGQCGHGTTEIVLQPRFIEGLRNVPISRATCGSDVTFFITSTK